MQIEEGRQYRFRYFPDDGETYLVEADRLINLTTPGGDLALAEDGRILRADGSVFGTTADLDPWPAASF